MKISFNGISDYARKLIREENGPVYIFIGGVLLTGFTGELAYFLLASLVALYLGIKGRI